jgi:hypothetical protein
MLFSIIGMFLIAKVTIEVLLPRRSLTWRTAEEVYNEAVAMIG